MTPQIVDPAPLHGVPQLSPHETAWGWPYGDVAGDGEASGGGPVHGVPSARDALEDLLRAALGQGPVVVSFSGGRDSSAVLAIAMHVARRHGLPLPAAVSIRYPGVAEADESNWQELVARHIGLEDWQVIDGTESHGALGTAAQEVLRESRVPLFPPGSAALGARAACARGGTLLTGEHGDWVLGYKRMTIARSLWRRRGRGGAWLWQAAATSLSPAPIRRHLAARTLGVLPWLRPAVAERRRREAAREEASVPLRWDREVTSLLDRRFLRLGSDTQQRVATSFGAHLLDPLAHPSFVRAYAAEGGALGFTSRTVGMQHLVGDLLPHAAIERSTKAYFTRAHSGSVIAEFARGWDGSGVDDDLVDPEVLRAQWLTGMPHALTLGLLQQAWLVREGVTT